MKTLSLSLLASLIVAICLSIASCGNGSQTPSKADKLAAYHNSISADTVRLLSDSLSLYVDYSTCVALGQNSEFFQRLAEPLCERTTAYYAIKGDNIEQIITKDVYSNLRNVEETNYAELKAAADQIAKGNCQAVLITDGEYYKPTIAKGNDNNPYLANAFRTWLLRGYDIYIVSESYTEQCKGKDYQKKRFYFLFTDSRLKNNIYDLVHKTVTLNDTNCFRLSARGVAFKELPHSNKNITSKEPELGNGFQVESWQSKGWNDIEEYVYKPEKPVFTFNINRNSLGGFKIKSVGVRTYDINDAYTEFYANPELKNAGTEFKNFLIAETDDNGNVELKFKNLDLGRLIGTPYNWLKVELYIGNVVPTFENIEGNDMFDFESISRPGEKNVSVTASIRQCLNDADVMNMIRGQVFYTIYLKTSEK